MINKDDQDILYANQYKVIYQNDKKAALINDKSIVVKKSIMPYTQKDPKQKLPMSVLTPEFIETIQGLLSKIVNNKTKEKHLFDYIIKLRTQFQKLLSKLVKILCYFSLKFNFVVEKI